VRDRALLGLLGLQALRTVEIMRAKTADLEPRSIGTSGSLTPPHSQTSTRRRGSRWRCEQSRQISSAR